MRNNDTDTTGGWIKLHRSLLDWEWWDDSNTMRLFLYCLLKANPTDKKWHGIVVKRGSFITSRDNLAAGTGLTVQQVRTSLVKLKGTGEITSRTTNKNTTITITNYDRYQITDTSEQPAKQPTNNQQITNKQPTNNHNEEYKNKRIEENNISLSPIGQGSKKFGEEKESELVEIDFEALVNFWNETTKGKFAQLRVIPEGSMLREWVRQRATKYGKAALQQAIEKAAASDFLQSTGWFNFEWLIKCNGNLEKVLQGNYDNSESKPRNNNTKNGRPETNKRPETIADPSEFIERL